MTTINSTRRRALLWFAMASVGTVQAATPTPLSAADERAVRAVVQGQLDAFAADDAERAFSFAANGIRELFGTPTNFMKMVRGSYPVVYRPASVVFLKPLRRDGQVLQAVQLSDAAGKPWLALYSLQAQRGGGWRIAGCEVAENEGRTS